MSLWFHLLSFDGKRIKGRTDGGWSKENLRYCETGTISKGVQDVCRSGAFLRF